MVWYRKSKITLEVLKVFIGDNKFVRVCATIAIGLVCLIFTIAILVPFFTSVNKPALRSVVFVLTFDIVALICFFYYSRKK